MKTFNDEKTFYFVVPGDESGFPELAAYTTSEYIAIQYANQYAHLNTEIITLQSDSIQNEEMIGFLENTYNYTFSENDEIVGYEITTYGQCKGDIFYLTISQDTTISECMPNMYSELNNLMLTSYLILKRMCDYGFIRVPNFGKILDYIFNIHIRRLIVIDFMDLTHLTNSSRKKLGFKSEEEQAYICMDDIIDVTAVTRNVIFNNDEDYVKSVRQHEQEMIEMFRMRVGGDD